MAYNVFGGTVNPLNRTLLKQAADSSTYSMENCPLAFNGQLSEL